MANSNHPDRIHFTVFIASNQAFRNKLSKEEINALIDLFRLEIANALMKATAPNDDDEMAQCTIVLGANVPSISIGREVVEE